MPKTRTKRKNGPQFVKVPTPNTIVLDDLNDIEPGDIKGQFVKVVTTIRASEREAFNKRDIRGQLLRMGARAVTMAPKVIPDSTRKQPSTRSDKLNSRVLLKQWVDNLDTSERKAVSELVERFMSEEGM